MLCRRLSSRLPIRAFAASMSVTPCPSFGVRWSSTEKPAEGAAAGAAGAKQEAPRIPDAHLKEIEDLKVQLKHKDEEIKNFRSQAMYAQAEADTARRVGREDTQKAKDFAVTAFGKDMLEVFDTLEKAIEALATIPKEEFETHKTLQSIFTGIKMSNTVLSKNLSRHGVEPMETKTGDEFDPNKHDAIFTAPATEQLKAGSVSNVVKKGYMIKERVLRPAQVGVAQ
jgi:molecular chaperone GrpE